MCFRTGDGATSELLQKVFSDSHQVHEQKVRSQDAEELGGLYILSTLINFVPNILVLMVMSINNYLPTSLDRWRLM